MIVSAKHLNEYDKSKWLTWVHTMLRFVPEDDLALIPEITVYGTLLAGLSDSFNMLNPRSDKTCKDYFSHKVWAFACLVQGDINIKPPKISLCVGREKELNVKTPMELTFFHEVGHFHLFHNRPYKEILSTDEVDADFYALVIYIRFLRELPHFKTFAESKNGKIAEEIYRDYISSYTHMSHFDLAKHMAEKVFKWKLTIVK